MEKCRWDPSLTGACLFTVVAFHPTVSLSVGKAHEELLSRLGRSGPSGGLADHSSAACDLEALLSGTRAKSTAYGSWMAFPGGEGGLGR
jgi:hypothetical protein